MSGYALYTAQYKNNSCIFKKSHILYSLYFFLFSFITICSGNWLIYTQQLQLQKFKKIYHFIFVFVVEFHLWSIVLIFIYSIKNTNKQVHFLSEIEEIDKKLAENGVFCESTKTYRKSFNLIMYEILLALIFPFISYFLSNTKFDTSAIIMFLSSSCYKLLTSAMSISFQVFLLLIKDRFEAVRLNIQDVFKSYRNSENYVCNQIVFTSKLYHKLICMKEMLNDMYSLPLLIFLCVNFVEILYNVYFVILKAKSIMEYGLFDNIYWIFYFCGCVFNLCRTCRDFTDDVSIFQFE